jgi:hypothetical protein
MEINELDKASFDSAENLPQPDEWPDVVNKDNLDKMGVLYGRCTRQWRRLWGPNRKPALDPTEPAWLFYLEKKVREGGEVKKKELSLEDIRSIIPSGYITRCPAIAGVFRCLGPKAFRRLPPIVVKEVEGEFRVEDGNARVAVARTVGMKTIPAYVV